MSGSSTVTGSVVPPKSLPPGKVRLRGMRKRWWIFFIVDFIVRFWPVFGKRKGVFVPRLDGIGDIVMFLPALARYPEVFGVAPKDITMLSLPYWHSLNDGLFKEINVVSFDVVKFEKNPWYRLKFGLWIRRQNFAVAVLDAFFRKALVLDAMVWMSGAPTVYISRPWISRKTQAEHAFYLGKHSYIDTGDYPTHEIERHFRFLSAVSGQTMTPGDITVPWPKGRSILPQDRPCVVLHFGCNEPGRRWPIENYERLMAELLDLGHTVVLTGTKQESDALKPDLPVLQHPRLINLVCKTTLPQMLDILADAAAIVTNETGPAHLAAIFGTPSVIIIGGGHFGNFVPYPQEYCAPKVHWVYQEMPCFHCFYNCTERKVDRTPFPCFAAVPYERVWGKLETILPSLPAQAAQ